MHKHNAVLNSLHTAAETLGRRRATTEGQHVKPKVGKGEAKSAAATLGHFSHSHASKKKKK